MIWRGVRRRRILFVKWIWSEVFILMVGPLRLIHPTRVAYLVTPLALGMCMRPSIHAVLQAPLP